MDNEYNTIKFTNGSVKNGQVLNDDTKNGHLSNGDTTDGHLLNNNAKNGLNRNGHTANGHTANGHTANGHTENGHTANGHTANGHTANGHSTNGSATNGKFKFSTDKKIENVANGKTIQTLSYGVEVPGSQIQEFYNGKSILITGVTGFVGKVLLERLLATCPGVDKIYVIIRGKKGHSASSRLEKFFQDPLFAYVDKKMQSKVNVVVGDLGLIMVGLSNEDYQMLIDNVHIVIHCAANVRFDATMKEQITTNVKGTSDLLDLAKNMKKLISFVYVSTIYSHYVKDGQLEERFYNRGLDLNVALGLTTIGADDEDTLQIINNKIIKSWPNMYTFSKGIAEYAVKIKGHGLPCCVFRPAVVSSTTYEHPVPGYLDNANGSIGYIVGIGLGACRLFPANPDRSMTLVPADYCANLIIACAWETAIKSNPEPLIYNYAPDDNLSWTVRMIANYSALHCRKEPFDKIIGYPMSIVKVNFLLYKISLIILNVLPAILGDGIRLLMGKQPIHLKLCRKLNKLSTLGYDIASKVFLFKTDNYRRLHESMNPVDKKLFNINLDDYTFEKNYAIFMRGIKHYVLKEDMQVSNEALRKLKRYKIYFFSSIFSLAIAVFYLIFYFITKYFF